MISAMLAAMYAYNFSGSGFSLLPMCIGFSVGIAINLVICYLLYNAQLAVPAEHRKIEPGLIWLLLIPLFNLVWNFFVSLRIPESYQSAFAARGMPQVGVSERSMGMAFAVCAACAIVPCLGLFAAIAALVLLIVFLVKIYGLKSQLQSTMGGGFEVNPPSNPDAR